jgi:hypothetical protein
MSRKIKVKEVSSFLLKSIPTIVGLNCLIKCSQTLDRHGNSSICVVVFDTTDAQTLVRFFSEELEAALFIERWVQ